MIYLEAVMKKLFLLLPLILFIGCASTPKVSWEEWTSNPDNLVAVYCCKTESIKNGKIHYKQNVNVDEIVTVCKVSEIKDTLKDLYKDELSEDFETSYKYYLRPYL